MDHAKAVEIAGTTDLDLIIDPMLPAVPELLVVRRRKGSAPYSITLPSINETEAALTDMDVDAEEQKVLVAALHDADRRLD